MLCNRNFLASWAIVHLQHLTQLVKCSVITALFFFLHWHLANQFPTSPNFLSSCLPYCRQIESIRWGGVGGGVEDGPEDDSITSVSASNSISTSGGGWLWGINEAASVWLCFSSCYTKWCVTLDKWIKWRKQLYFYLHVVNTLLSSIIFPALPRKSLFLSNDYVGSWWWIIRIGESQDGNLLRLAGTAT